MARVTKIGDYIHQYGSDVRVERGLAPDRDTPPNWVVYTKTDVADDPDTTHDERWDEVASYLESKPGEMPAKAHERAEALAAKE